MIGITLNPFFPFFYLDFDQYQYFNQHQDLDTQWKELILFGNFFETLVVQSIQYNQARGSLLFATALKPKTFSCLGCCHV